MALRRAEKVARPAAAPAAIDDEFHVDSGGQRLGELLVARNVVTKTQLIEALLQQSASGKRIGALLVELGALDERALAELLAEQMGVPLVDLRTDIPDPEAVKRLPETVARNVNAVPIRVDGDVIEIAVADPSDHFAKLLSDAANSAVRLCIAPASDIRWAVDNSYRALAGVDEQIQAFEATDSLRRAAAPLEFQQSLAGDDAPVVKVVNLMITQGLRDRASDIHIEPQDRRVRIRYRIDGALHDVLALPANIGPALVSRIKIMAGMNIVEKRRSQDGQIAMDVDGRDLDIRVSTTATIWGEKAVLRLLDKSRTLYRVQDLGMPDDTADTYSKLVHSPFGMVVCSGPTGSGKTTTLYATLAEINDPRKNIVTIEDPVEYVFPSINQIQINEQAGITFAGGLRSILRQDPDIILVGEMRDVETARIAVQSALTGHFVLSSIHATDASAALHRFIDMGIEPFLISSSLRAIVGQRLLRRICTSCAVEATPTAEELAFYEASGGTAKKRFWRGEGCNFCAKTGYLDRIGVYELLRVTERMKSLVLAGAGHDQIRGLAIEEGMRTLRQEAIRLVEEDVTTVDEVMRTVYTL
ncbi:MAG TPA: GspE/PulE family protein [Acidimicrobiales bacterium]|nr:GspE/PulE family protein [Acidimicrobiales bacterium]